MEALSTLGHFFLTLLIGLVVLTVLVFVHELGHYLVAKRLGMRVNAFAIFMGGVRKTDLSPWLDRPLAPSQFVWGAFVVAFAATVVGALLQSDVVYLVGLACAGVAVPVWAMLRMAALYHVKTSQVIGVWLKSVAVGAVVLALGTKLQGVDANMVIAVASGASLIALALVYYLPVQMREPDDDKQGYGEIEVKCGEDGSLDKLPVRYRPIWSKQGRDGTEFSLLLLPLGGFASIAGMHAKPDGSEVNVSGGFYSKPPLHRLLVLFAGPFFSVGFGVLVLWCLYSTSGKDLPDVRPIVGGVSTNGPAQSAGIKVGDVITEVDGSPVREFYDVIALVRDNWRTEADGKRVAVPTQIKYLRDGAEHVTTVVPKVDETPGPTFTPELEIADEKAIQARLGIGFDFARQRYSVGEAFGQAVDEPVRMVVSIASIPLRPAQAAEKVSGPTSMAKVTSSVVQQGVHEVVWFAAMLSISLGVMNLLPIVPLDGGQMVVAFVELLRGGRRLSLKFQNLLANSGLALLVLLMLAVSAVDLGRSAEANKAQEKEGTGARHD